MDWIGSKCKGHCSSSLSPVYITVNCNEMKRCVFRQISQKWYDIGQWLWITGTYNFLLVIPVTTGHSLTVSRISGDIVEKPNFFLNHLHLTAPLSVYRENYVTSSVYVTWHDQELVDRSVLARTAQIAEISQF